MLSSVRLRVGYLHGEAHGARLGATLGALVAAVPATLVAEAVLARSRRYVDPGSAPPMSGRYGTGVHAGATAPVTLLVLGDSTAAGLGVQRDADAVGGRLAAALAAAGRPVTLRGYAVSGARCADLGAQVARAAADLTEPDGTTGTGDRAAATSDDRLGGRQAHRRVVAVVLIGANDATRLTRLATVEALLARTLVRLTDSDVRVVLAECPDLGAARALAWPLRAVIARRGRAVAAAQRRTVDRLAGVSAVALAVTGPAFRRDPALLSWDLFHPSAAGYARWADVLLPAVARAADDGRE